MSRPARREISSRFGAAPRCAAADRAEAEQSDVDGFHDNVVPWNLVHIFLSKSNDVITVPSRK